ncbi:MAG TPA: hypothetical protein VMH01_12090 [Puia sp.]|nr:hypothetical protein [Puia sp.]
MKKQILILAVLCISTSIFITNADAQSLKNNLGSADTKYMEVSLFGSSTTISAGSENLNSINAKAVRDFSKNYKGISDEKWFKVSNGFVSEFKTGDVANMAAYSLNGKWQFTISYYNENKLDASIRAIAKSMYYDFSITLVEEIHTPEKTLYVIHMQDENTWKNVWISDEEIISEDNFNKR